MYKTTNSSRLWSWYILNTLTMGWSTNLYTQISFSRKTYTDIYQVDEDIRDCKDMIQMYQKKLSQLAFMTEPKKCCPEEWNDYPLDWIQNELRECFEELDDYYWQLSKLEILKDSWDKCHNKETGLAIDPPKECAWNKAYLDGDFVPTINEPNKK